MELQLYLEILRRRIVVIVLVVALTLAVVITASLFITPSYRAYSTVRVIQDVGVVDLRIYETYGERLMNTYSQILAGWPVLEQAIDQLDASMSPGQLREKVQIEVIPKTELIRITVEDSSPRVARDFANKLAELLVEQAQSIYAGNTKSALQIVEEQLAAMENDLVEDRNTLAALLNNNAPNAEIEAVTSQIKFKEDAYDRLLDRYELARLNESLRANSITIVAPASTPGSPFNALSPMDIAVALIVGLFGGIGLALVMENLDNRIHSPLQLEHLTQLPVLGTVARGSLSLDSLGHRYGTGHSDALAEVYRLLGINLEALRQDAPLESILITSAVPREEKAEVAVNLALVLAERGQTVFLVESDLRQPSVSRLLNIVDHGPGLSSFLDLHPSLSAELVSQVTHSTEQPSLFFISGGPEVMNPTALLASPQMEEFIAYLADKGQTTLLNAPPVLGLADVSILAPMSDGVILVAQRDVTDRDQISQALKQLKAVQANIIGHIFIQ